MPESITHRPLLSDSWGDRYTSSPVEADVLGQPMIWDNRAANFLEPILSGSIRHLVMHKGYAL